MKVLQLFPEQWSAFAENAHRVAFGEIKRGELDRIDYALLVVNPATDKPAGYVTCRELDAETVYWQFGGAMPETKGTIQSFWAYLALIEFARERYKRIGTLIENTNTPMLRIAMKAGFRITGIRVHQSSILLEHSLEFSGG